MADDLAQVLVDRIKELLSEKGWNYKRFSEETGIASPHISNLMKGNQSVSFARIEVIAKTLGVDASELFVREKPKLPTLHPADFTATVPIQDWGEVSAGEPRPQTEPKTVLMPKVFVPESSGTLVMFRVRGHSMTKRYIHEGSLLFVRIDPAPRVGEKVVAVVNSRKKRGPRGYVVKVLKQGGEWMELHSASDDDTAEPMIVDESVEVIGVVEGILTT